MFENNIEHIKRTAVHIFKRFVEPRIKGPSADLRKIFILRWYDYRATNLVQVDDAQNEALARGCRCGPNKPSAGFVQLFSFVISRFGKVEQPLQPRNCVRRS